MLSYVSKSRKARQFPHTTNTEMQRIMDTVFMYPGQGSQAVGMGKDLVEKFPSAKKRFDEADSALGRSISRTCFEGPEDDLKATQNTQPALFTIEAALTDVLRENGVVPSVTMGHSLGEYSALYGAGVFSFADGLRLVARRGQLMASVGRTAPGTMAAVIGMDKSKIVEVLSSVTEGIVVCANENSPDQTVISGEVAAVNAACEKLKAAGAKRVVPLPVSGAFHSPLMQKAADEFGAAVDAVTWQKPACPIIANVTASPQTDATAIKGLLIKQLLSPVRWVDSVAGLKARGPLRCIEVGPGAVLQGLARKIDKDLTVVGCGTAENVFSVIGRK